ncbi:hypothetical protein [Geminicoccus harenae]|uniref:hypothetical protein n=1 Tax=Geminicoccus harenae TaxID=2498453 RepID=UPI001C93E26A|nr:hypothetical protein [Geminicoccus harenae]
MATGSALLTLPVLGTQQAEAQSTFADDTEVWGNLFYGNAVSNYGSGNTRLNAQEAFSYWYRSEMTGYLAAVRIVFESGSGYAAGDGGGPYNLQIRSDNNGIPGSVIATSINSFNAPPSSTLGGSQANWAVEFKFPSTVSLTKNDIVHFVVLNNRPGGGQSANYLSVNHFNGVRLWQGENQYTQGSGVLIPSDPLVDAWKRSPYYHSRGDAALTASHKIRGIDRRGPGGAWASDWSKFPTIELDFKQTSTGPIIATKGQSIIYRAVLTSWAGLANSSNYFPLSNTNKVQLNFTPTTRTRIIGTECFTRLHRTGASVQAFVKLSGPLTSSGAADSVTFTFNNIDGPSSSLNEPQQYDPDSPRVGWIRSASASKAGPFYLHQGSSYTVEWSSVAGSTVAIKPHDMSDLPPPSHLTSRPEVVRLNRKPSFYADTQGGSYTVNGVSGTFAKRTSLPFLFRVIG